MELFQILPSFNAAVLILKKTNNYLLFGGFLDIENKSKNFQ